MKAKLIAQGGAEKGTEFWIGAEAAIGRGGDNGTQIDGTAVVRTERLGRLHVLEFGGVCELLFVTVDTSAEPEAVDAAPPDEGTRIDAEPPALPDALAAGSDEAGEGTHVEEAPVALPAGLAADEAAPVPTPEEPEFVLAVLLDKGAPRRFALREGENLIGRTQGAEVALASRQLSRRHAMLTIRGGRVTLRDLGSRNHTYLEDERLADAEVEVAARSRLRFGLVEAYLLRHDDDDRTIPLDVS